MVNRSHRPMLVAFVVALSAACSDSTGTRTYPAGTLSVALSGALSGQYDVSGAQPASPAQGPATFAAARVSPVSSQRYLVSGFRARDGNRQDLLSFELQGVSAPGTYVAAGNLVLGGASSALPDQVYRITGGNVVITSLSAARMAGTFSGKAIGGTFPSTFPPPADTVHLSAGIFDVPIIRP